MSEPEAFAPVITAQHVAVALVAACAFTGRDVKTIFEPDAGGGSTRVLAAAAGVARLGWSKPAAGRAFRVHPNRLAPSGLVLARVTTDGLLAVAEALQAAGLTGDDRGAARFRQPWVAQADGAKAAAGPLTGGPEVGGRGGVETAAKVESEAKETNRVRRAARLIADPAGDAIQTPRPEPLRSEPFRPQSGRPVAAAPRIVASQRVERLKPVTADIVRWTRQQVALGVRVDLMADLFGVDGDALAQALTGERRIGRAA